MWRLSQLLEFFVMSKQTGYTVTMKTSSWCTIFMWVMYVRVTWILWPKVFSKTSHRSLYCSVLTLACPLKATEVLGDSQQEYSVLSVGENYDALCELAGICSVYYSQPSLPTHILKPWASVVSSAVIFSCINFSSTCGDALTMFSIILSLVKVIQTIKRAYLFLLQELMMNIFKLVKHFNVQGHFVHLVRTNLAIMFLFNCYYFPIFAPSTNKIYVLTLT